MELFWIILCVGMLANALLWWFRGKPPAEQIRGALLKNKFWSAGLHIVGLLTLFFQIINELPNH